ncbi:kinase-like protein [Hypoxylon trugodes]|uniref:kinase-like protein n=1 Tax=Hypoxylon trugodes TaxID=326681 RepID=UPI0021990AFA|nr:kinase-like protein [Hypoxylon trugodes]KAI1389905.1 kinase-like protein [Hypoxylon trugodes]
MVHLTPGNVLFNLQDLRRYNKDDMYSFFGQPKTEPVRTVSGEPTGPETRRYIVKPIDFLASKVNFILPSVSLIDFDLSFLLSKPHNEAPGCPTMYVAPEVALGRPAGFASDVWALGCTIYELCHAVETFPLGRIHTFKGLFKEITKMIGYPPQSWGPILFNDFGYPTKDPDEGEPLDEVDDMMSIRELVEMLQDPWPEASLNNLDEFPEGFLGIFYKPAAAHAMSKKMGLGTEHITRREADQLTDLLGRMFVYEPAKRARVDEIMDHPWFDFEKLPEGQSIIGLPEDENAGI